MIQVNCCYQGVDDVVCPSTDDFTLWLSSVFGVFEVAFDIKLAEAFVDIAIVDKQTVHRLNARYRHKYRPTNTLSFPYTVPSLSASAHHSCLKGEIILCAPVIIDEATQAEKSVLEHWAYLTVHSALHLCGMTHANAEDAQAMEALEVKALQDIGYL